MITDFERQNSLGPRTGTMSTDGTQNLTRTLERVPMSLPPEFLDKVRELICLKQYLLFS